MSTLVSLRNATATEVDALLGEVLISRFTNYPLHKETLRFTRLSELVGFSLSLRFKLLDVGHQTFAVRRHGVAKSFTLASMLFVGARQ